MINVKFTKLESAAFMSHLNLLKTINRIIKRAGFEPKFSKGFNPHALLKLSNPIPLGLKSEAEYFTVELEYDVDLQDFLDKCNATTPSGIKFLKAFKSEKNPNFARDIFAVRYILFENDKQIEIEELKTEIPTSVKPIKLLEQINETYNTQYTISNLTKTNSYMLREREILNVDKMLLISDTKTV